VARAAAAARAAGEGEDEEAEDSADADAGRHAGVKLAAPLVAPRAAHRDAQQCAALGAKVAGLFSVESAAGDVALVVLRARVALLAFGSCGPLDGELEPDRGGAGGGRVVARGLEAHRRGVVGFSRV